MNTRPDPDPWAVSRSTDRNSQDQRPGRPRRLGGDRESLLEPKRTRGVPLGDVGMLVDDPVAVRAQPRGADLSQGADPPGRSERERRRAAPAGQRHSAATEIGGDPTALQAVSRRRSPGGELRLVRPYGGRDDGLSGNRQLPQACPVRRG